MIGICRNTRSEISPIGLRFRRSVKILPGVRLNFTTAGLSTTLGPRGASVNIGSRGAHLNLGLPGTGLSYRVPIDSARSGPSAEPRIVAPSSRVVARRQRQEEREALRHQAEDLQAEREARLTALQDILRNRERELVDWEEEYASAGPYVPRVFVPPGSAVSPEQVRTEVGAANPLRPWFISGLAAAAAAMIAPQWWMRFPLIAVTAYLALQSVLVARGRAAELERVLHERQAQRQDDEAQARAAHEVEETTRAQQHEQEELLRARLRETAINDDAEAAALVLEIELSNEDLPIAVAYEAEFDGVQHLVIRVDLPPLDEIPVTRTRVTKTGKFSERPMAVRDRVALYQDVCAGLALRLVHEVYRVLPFMKSVDLTGVAEGVSLVTGHPERFPALHLATTREQFLAVNLDDIEPSLALEGLGGRLAMSRVGELKAVDPTDD